MTYRKRLLTQCQHASKKKSGADGAVDGRYQFEIPTGVAAADQAPERVSELMLAHIGAHPV